MLKKYIYLIIIPLIFISCSKPTIVGDWMLSESSAFKAIETSSGMSYYYDLEIKEKLASQILNNSTYSFSENGLLSISVLSSLDSAYYNFSGSWKFLDSEIMEIAVGSSISEKYKFKLSDSLLTLESLLDSTKRLAFDKK